MAGERRAQPDLRRFLVAHLADQNDVGILPQSRAQHAREGEFDLLVDLHLVDARQAVFHRILHGDDLAVDRIEFGERRVQRRGLAAAGRARHEDHAGGALQQLAEAREHAGRHAEAVQAEQSGFRFSSRSTTDSPYCVGMVDMRTSIFWSRTMMFKRPSCGRRFSEMSRPAISFRRSTSAGPICSRPRSAG